MHAAEIGVLEQSNDIGLRCFLQGDECLRLVAEVATTTVCCNIAYKALEWGAREEILH